MPNNSTWGQMSLQVCTNKVRCPKSMYKQFIPNLDMLKLNKLVRTNCMTSMILYQESKSQNCKCCPNMRGDSKSHNAIPSSFIPNEVLYILNTQLLNLVMAICRLCTLVMLLPLTYQHMFHNTNQSLQKRLKKQKKQSAQIKEECLFLRMSIIGNGVITGSEESSKEYFSPRKTAMEVPDRTNRTLGFNNSE